MTYLIAGSIGSRGLHAEVHSQPEDRGAHYLDKVEESVVVKGEKKVEREIARLHCGRSPD